MAFEYEETYPMASEVYRVQRHGEHDGSSFAGKEGNIGQNGCPSGGDERYLGPIESIYNQPGLDSGMVREGGVLDKKELARSI